MKDIEIKISKENRCVCLSKSYLGNDAENLQGNLVFSFKDEFVNGQARLELTIDGQDSWIPLLKDGETYYCPIKSAITKYGKIYMQLVITENEIEEGVPIFKSNTFYVWCEKSIDAEIEQPEEYPTWIEIANEKLNEIDNLDIDATKVEDTCTVTITKKDGTIKSVEIKDGETGPQGPKGDPGAIKMQVVQTLPSTGLEDTIYLVPSTDPATQNLYDEYIYTNNAWEKIGNTNIDLSDYATIDDITVEFNDGSQSYTWETSQDMFNYIATNFGGALNQIFDDLDNKQSKSLMIQSINEYSSSNSYPSGSAVYDYGNVVVDLTGTTTGTLITDTTLVSKLLDDRCIIKYGNSNYRFARLQDGVIRLYTVMDDFTSGKYIALVNQNGSLLFYETGSTEWEVPTNKVTSLSSSSTDTQYPSAKCVYDALQGAGGGDAFYLGNVADFTQANPLNISDLDVGLYALNPVGNVNNIYVNGTNGGNDFTGSISISGSSGLSAPYMIYLEITQKVSEMTLSTSLQTFGYLKAEYYGETAKKIEYVFINLKIAVTSNNVIYISTSQSKTPFNLLTTDGTQTISGAKTFSTLPQSSVVPSNDNDLVNKKYVDDNAGGGGSSNYLGSLDVVAKSSNRLDLTNLEPGVYYLLSPYNPAWGSISKLYFTANSSGTVINGDIALNIDATNIPLFYDIIVLVITKKIADIEVTSSEKIFGRLEYISFAGATDNEKIVTFREQLSIKTSAIKIYGGQQKTTFNIATKKYVDDSIASAITTTLGGNF